MTGRLFLLHVLREMFPQWDVFVDDRSVWRAAGVVLVSASSAEVLADTLLKAEGGGDSLAVRRGTDSGCSGRGCG